MPAILRSPRCPDTPSATPSLLLAMLLPLRLMVLFAAISCGSARAADPAPSADTAIWSKVRTSLFQDRAIADSAERLITFELPARAEDAAVVPIRIAARELQTPGPYIKNLYLIIDNNPSPIAAVFHLTPDTGRADIETRVRIEAYSWVRAIVETSDGKLAMTRHYLKASGGCSAPAGADAAAARVGLGRMKLVLEQAPQINQPTLVQLMIRHPNSSGLAVDQITHLSEPPHFIRRVDVTYAGRPVMSADVDFSVSENPNFRFYFLPRAAGELAVVAEDSNELTFRTTLAVSPQ